MCHLSNLSMTLLPTNLSVMCLERKAKYTNTIRALVRSQIDMLFSLTQPSHPNFSETERPVAVLTAFCIGTHGPK